MFNYWKQRLTKDWHFTRVLRLGLAILILTEAWKNNELLFAALGAILLLQAVLNVGCCGTSGCDINHTRTERRSAGSPAKDTTFEEVK